MDVGQCRRENKRSNCCAKKLQKKFKINFGVYWARSFLHTTNPGKKGTQCNFEVAHDVASCVRFLTLSRKTKTKVITDSGQSRRQTYTFMSTKQNSKQVQEVGAKRGKTGASNS